jgi:hypothetical protein
MFSLVDGILIYKSVDGKNYEPHNSKLLKNVGYVYFIRDG